MIRSDAGGVGTIGSSAGRIVSYQLPRRIVVGYKSTRGCFK